ncbi:thioester reductase domain-containing protein [Duganella sp. LX20W]|uniref:Thioester reductase domain-containing protein n=1 Tax=Rugamonas brunnea TaxID=2758569 RepID=A0A7W2ENF6_9BURK|nr:thioester reductase domain-containing protein [Rugamonas brunnea]MBA5635716.1 thioester reductase domain-containing protein [Rugamonas brunnea]
MDSIFDLLEHWTGLQPDKVLFEFRDRLGQTSARHTYRSFHAHTLALAARLMATPSLAPGARVLLAYPAGLEGVAALLACARAGMIGVPVALPRTAGDTAMRRLHAIGENCGAAALLTDDLHAARLAQLFAAAGTTPPWPLLALDDGAASQDAGQVVGSLPPRRHERLLFLQYTSGSTGLPRGVMVSHENVIANARATLDHVPTGVSWLPQHHDMGLIGYYLFPIISGGSNYGFAPVDFLRRPSLWLRMIAEVGATYSSSPNFGFEYCLREGKVSDAELDGVDLSCLRVLMNAGEPARPDTIRRFHRRFARFGLARTACTVAYGLAENTLNVTHGGCGSVAVVRDARAGADIATTLALADAAAGGRAVEYASCGTPVAGVEVRICAAESGRAVAELEVGEIRVGGPCVTAGYWNNAAATRALLGGPVDEGGGIEDRWPLRTGDLGFLHQGQLYVCGRSKDMLIIGGANFFPDDLEQAVAASGAAVRPRGICAFQCDDGSVTVLAEPLRADTLPDPAMLALAIRATCGLLPDQLHVVAPGTVAMTTSGKIARAETRALFEAGKAEALASWRNDAPELPQESDQASEQTSWRSAVQRAFARQGIASDSVALADLGIDSLALTEIQLELEDVLRGFGSGALAEALDAQLLQRLSQRSLLSALAPLDHGQDGGADAAMAALAQLRAALDDAIAVRMLEDRDRPLPATEDRSHPLPAAEDRGHPLAAVDSLAPPAGRAGRAILLTGVTGFFGPFLLDELLRQGDDELVLLVRASDPAVAMARVEAALRHARLLTPALHAQLRARARAVCGDLALPSWGLDPAQWLALAHSVGEVFHNGACVNYVMTYEAMRATNVEGTRTALRLARDSGARCLHLVSSTFIFGWSAKGVLLESDCNAGMEALDFGYAQSKWVAEQQALAARAAGMDVRIYRPSLISVSTQGAGDDNDVALRMLAFMIRHGIAVDTPNQLSIVAADVIAHNIVAIARQPQAPVTPLHVTADHYYSMTALTRVIERDFGYQFRYYDIPHFIDQLNLRCSASDPVYPLLDFFNRSADKIAAMQLKRYSSNAYRQARDALEDGRADPSLELTASYLVRYLLEQGMIAPLTVAAEVDGGAARD